ncbi:hypothetical protein Tco_0792375, partial [Tanacetum coccineum]
STNKSRVSIVDDDARTKDSAQLETPISESDKENVDVIGSTSSRKDTRNGKYATEISVFEGSSLNEGHKQVKNAHQKVMKSIVSSNRLITKIVPIMYGHSVSDFKNKNHSFPYILL